MLEYGMLKATMIQKFLFTVCSVVLLAGCNQTPSKPAVSVPTEVGQQAPSTASAHVSEGYTGTLLAGTTTPYLDFTQADYTAAKAAGKVILLNFYATWCPICRAEAPKLQAGFDALANPNVIAFRVNYNDDQTDADEKALAKEFGVTYQHTKVLIVNGQEVLKVTKAWDKDTVVKELGKR